MKGTCTRCGKKNEELLSNDLCVRCDDVLYGKKSRDWIDPYKPYKWIYDGPPPKVTYYSEAEGSYRQPCLVEQCLEEQRKRGVRNPVALIVCGCPKCRLHI